MVAHSLRVLFCTWDHVERPERGGGVGDDGLGEYCWLLTERLLRCLAYWVRNGLTADSHDLAGIADSRSDLLDSFCEYCVGHIERHTDGGIHFHLVVSVSERVSVDARASRFTRWRSTIVRPNFDEYDGRGLCLEKGRSSRNVLRYVCKHVGATESPTLVWPENFDWRRGDFLQRLRRCKSEYEVVEEFPSECMRHFGNILSIWAIQTSVPKERIHDYRRHFEQKASLSDVDLCDPDGGWEEVWRWLAKAFVGHQGTLPHKSRHLMLLGDSDVGKSSLGLSL